MLPESIYEVSRADYVSFVEQIKPDCRRVETVQIDKRHIATKIFSTNTNKCLCSRLTYVVDYEEPEPEKYFIFEMPENYERLAPTPKIHITLQSKEEVQKFFDYFAQKRQEEQSND